MSHSHSRTLPSAPARKSGTYPIKLTPEQRTDLRIMRKQNEMVLAHGCGRPACAGRTVCMFERQAQIALMAVEALEELSPPSSVRTSA
jgi:hypothetical protein